MSDHFGTSCIKIKSKEIRAEKVQIWHSFIWNGLVLVCDDLRDMVPLAQLKKNLENTHGGLLLLVLKATLLHGCFSRVFFRLYKWYQFPRSSSFLFSSFKTYVGVAEVIEMEDGFQLAIHGDETFQEIFKNSFFIEHLQWLLLNMAPDFADLWFHVWDHWNSYIM